MAPLARLAILALPLALLAGCSGGGGGSATPTPTPTGTGASALNVQNCLDQSTGRLGSVANVLVPDTIKVDFTQPSGFPNGRRLADPVIDITLAWIFIDLTKHSPMALANVPINPAANDVAFRAEFPYLAPPQGASPPPPGGSNFNFRTDAPSAYVQVDRMGMPAVATAVISSAAKSAYNDDSPAIDGTRRYVNEITSTLGGLTAALNDDFTRAGFSLCARPG